MASQFYQLLSGHAAVGPYLKEMKLAQSDACWRCGSGERQSRHHLFVRRQAWAIQTKESWRSVGKACGRKHPRAPAVRLLTLPRRMRRMGDQGRKESNPSTPHGG